MLKWIVFDESEFSKSVGKDIRNRDHDFASIAKLFAPRALLSLLQDSILRKTNGLALSDTVGKHAFCAPRHAPRF
ncbi:MAG: hypothetical protein WC271_15285 [Bacteroidales bacterium]|jgi:hypothetical protein|nr:hypothetical protein [Bacteroidales bacterium]NLO51743.1 hypothetical protein [Bacteroidales bacterium]